MRILAVVAAVLSFSIAGCGEQPREPARPAKLPAGISDGRVLYSAAVGGNSTQVRAIDRRTRRVLRQTTLPGRWAIPGVAGRDLAGSLSGDGRTLALAGDGSRFALLDTRLRGKPRTFSFPGRWSFDALSPDAGMVYLIEHTASGHYRVRAYYPGAEKLRQDPIVEKGEEDSDGDMTGVPVAREIGPGGETVYTLYSDAEHGPFVHALNTEYGIALCVDLARGKGWRLAWAGSQLYAVGGGERVAVNSI